MAQRTRHSDCSRPPPPTSCQVAWTNGESGPSVYHQSKLYLNSISQSAYNLVDLNANFRIDQNLSVQLNLNNVFDEKYYTAIFSQDTGNYYGEPRNFAVTLRYEN